MKNSKSVNSFSSILLPRHSVDFSHLAKVLICSSPWGHLALWQGDWIHTATEHSGEMSILALGNSIRNWRSLTCPYPLLRKPVAVERAVELFPKIAYHVNPTFYNNSNSNTCTVLVFGGLPYFMKVLCAFFEWRTNSKTFKNIVASDLLVVISVALW